MPDENAAGRTLSDLEVGRAYWVVVRLSSTDDVEIVHATLCNRQDGWLSIKTDDGQFIDCFRREKLRGTFWDSREEAIAAAAADLEADVARCESEVLRLRIRAQRLRMRAKALRWELAGEPQPKGAV